MATSVSEIYCNVAIKPTLKNARIVSLHNGTQFHVKSEWCQEDPERRDTSQFQQTAFLSLNTDLQILDLTALSDVVVTSLTGGFPFSKENAAHVLWDLCDDVRHTRAVCIEYCSPSVAMGAQTSTRKSCPLSGTFVQIWSNGRLKKTVTLPTEGKSAKHGRVYANGPAVFSGACLSRDASWIAYTAEAYKADNVEDTNGETPFSIADSPFAHHENWGEGVTEVSKPVLCLLDIQAGLVSCLVHPDVYHDIAPTSPICTPDGEGIVFIGYRVDSYPLGVTYCNQRPCCVYALDRDTGELKTLSPSDQAASCPRFSPNGQLLVWLQNPVGGPHYQCRSLVGLSWPPTNDQIGRPHVFVACVDTPDAPNGFPGLYIDLPLRCWTADSRFIVTSTQWGFRTAALIVTLVTETGEYTRDLVQPIPSPLILECNTTAEGQQVWDSVLILDVHENIATACVSSPSRAPFLSVIRLTELLHCTCSSRSTASLWLCIPTTWSPDITRKTSAILPAVDVDCSVHLLHSGDQEQLNFAEALLLVPTFTRRVSHPFPSSDALKPTRLYGLIVWPHGGPHSVLPARWSPQLAAFLACGYACLLVNYRGSLGYGQQQIWALVDAGIGKADVDDCVQATNLAINHLRCAYELHVPPPVFLFGGSHGGFLSLWLAATHASLFTAAVVRNPVSNLVSMIDVSDIPDWCYAESGLLARRQLWSLGHTPSGEELKRLAEVSPIGCVGSGWTVPLLLCLGGKDCRVPMSQGISVLRKIRSAAKSVPCQALIFPHDAHPLESPVTSREVTVATINWFRQHAEYEC